MKRRRDREREGERIEIEILCNTSKISNFAVINHTMIQELSSSQERR